MRPLIPVLCLALIVRLWVAGNNLASPGYPIQQDNYADYAIAMESRQLTGLSWADTRLFPGYPYLIRTLSDLIGNHIYAGITVSVLGSLAALTIYYLIFRDLTATLIWAIFPPVWVELGAKVANEPLVIALFFLSLYLSLRRKWLLAGMIAGLSISVRLIALALMTAQFFLTKKRAEQTRYLLGVVTGSLLLLIHNVYYFGSENIFYQLFTNPRIGGAGGLAIGLWQLPQDIYRAFAWGQWRIAAVGTVYVLFVGFGTYLLYRYKGQLKLGKLVWTWHIANLVFVLSLAPIPLLEEFSRYIAPSYPLLLLGYSAILQKWIALRFGLPRKATKS